MAHSIILAGSDCFGLWSNISALMACTIVKRSFASAPLVGHIVAGAEIESAGQMV